MLTLNREDLISILPKNANVVEIGVDKADFSKIILAKSKPKSLILIDPWIEMLDIKTSESAHQEKYNHVAKMFEGNNIVKIIKKSSKEAVIDIADKSIDWIYIDGDHKYEGCLNDLHNYSNKVKDNGYICGHDWVTSTKKGFGVNRAVEKFLEDTGFFLCGLTNETNFKSYVIAKNKKSRDNLLDRVK